LAQISRGAAVADSESVRAEPGFVAKLVIIAVTIIVIWVVWQTALVFLLGFGGIVVAVVLTTLSVPLARRFRMPPQLALAIVAVALVLLLAAFLALFGAQAAAQATQLFNQFPRAWDATRMWLQSFIVGTWVLELIDTGRPGTGAILSAVPFAGGFLNWVADAVLILVIGIYLAADAETYFEGAVRLFPPQKRPRARAIMFAAGSNLRKWLIAMMLDGIAFGTLIGIGLWIVGSPFPLPLGVLAGFSVFIPYIGPLVTLVPVLLFGLSVSPMTGLYAALVYIIGHQFEANLSQPILQRRTVELPPVMTLLAVVGFGLLFGVWGILLASPLAVATMTVIKMAYVEDVLEKRV
jgi:predicted PurR-regulated permease PerM